MSATWGKCLADGANVRQHGANVRQLFCNYQPAKCREKCMKSNIYGHFSVLCLTFCLNGGSLRVPGETSAGTRSWYHDGAPRGAEQRDNRCGRRERRATTTSAAITSAPVLPRFFRITEIFSRKGARCRICRQRLRKLAGSTQVMSLARSKRRYFDLHAQRPEDRRF